MTLLLWLTLVWAGVLILVLVAGLTLAWLRLRAIDRSLIAVREALFRTRDATADFDRSVAPVRGRLLATLDALQSAVEAREGADPRLRDRFGAGAAGAR